MLESKSYAQIRAYYRKKLISKIQELLETDETLNMSHYKEQNLNVDVVFKNEEVLIVTNEKFEELFNQVDFDSVLEACLDKKKGVSDEILKKMLLKI